MRTLAIIAMLLAAAACSNGGGGFTPSGNLDITHAFLRAQWNGTSRDDATGVQSNAGISIYTPGGISSTEYLACTAGVQVYSGGGTLRAGGDRVIGSVSVAQAPPWFPGGAIEFDLRVTDNQTRLIGTYRFTINATATAQQEIRTGTYNLLRGARNEAMIERQEIIETPEVVVIVRTVVPEDR